MTTPQIIAHRGASYLAPENTLVAFRKAMEIGADGVEMDVQKTYDNELVIHHDYMVDMHTDISGQIYDLTMGELKALDFGSWKDAIYANERIATLQEALELCAGMEGTQVQLELKSPLEDDPECCAQPFTSTDSAAAARCPVLCPADWCGSRSA